MFSNELTRVLDSDCTPSSVNYALANSSGINVSTMVWPTEHVPSPQNYVAETLTDRFIVVTYLLEQTDADV
jgi:hypothetical protein